MAERMRHLAGAALCAVVLALLATGCTPDPAPTPSPTGFASDEEAFAAAEATYRAYVDAVNARNAGATTGPKPTDFLTGAALQGELDSQRQFDELGIKLGGPMEVTAFDRAEVGESTASGLVCLDVSKARVIDAESNDVTPVDRADRLGLAVDFVWAPGGAIISQSLPSDSACF